MSGSKKPIIDVPESTLPALIEPNEFLPCRDGRELLAIDILVEVAGNVDIACERACDLPKADFLFHLARTEPKHLAEGLKAIQLLQVFSLATKVGQAISDQIGEIKPGQLVALYPKLVELIPVLSESKLSVHATQNNTYNIGTGDQTPPEIPDDIREAMSRLGLALPGVA